MQLGQLKLARIGKDKPKEEYSGHTHERLLFKELEQQFKELYEAPDKILNTSKMRVLEEAPKELLSESKLVSGTFRLELPASIQNQFTLLSQCCQNPYLHGSALLELILKKHHQASIYPEDFDFITTSAKPKTIIGAGFNQCKHNSNLYFHTVPEGRLELLSINEDPVFFMAKRLFTISTLYCSKNGEVQDLTGQGFTDLLQKRLVILEDPVQIFSQDPTSILCLLKYCIKGFHPDFRIIQAFKQLKPLIDFDRGHFDAIAKKQLGKLDYLGRKNYVNLLLRFDLLKKYFNISYNGNMKNTISQLEQLLGVLSLSIAKNQNGLFSKDVCNENSKSTGNTATFNI